jgi:hypothetical protein
MFGHFHIEAKSGAGGGGGGSARVRRRRRRAVAVGVAASLVAGGGLFLGAVPAAASTAMSAHPQTRDLPAAIVTLGDSYISGEGGRWQGNAAPWVDFGDRYGTDRAATNCVGPICWHEPAAKIYGDSYANGCDRSDVAEVKSSELSGFALINLACSGAETINVMRAVDGGQPFKSEAPQADQLHNLLGQYQVKLIVLSIGGNDLRFSPVLKACALNFVLHLGHCSSGSTRTQFDADLANLEPKLVSTLQSIHAAMAGVDYTYQLVFQSYPEPVPPSADYRYSQGGETRLTTGGCPLYDADSDWARNSVVPEVAAKQLLAAETDHDVYFDLQHVYDGHELCSTSDRQAVSSESLSDPIPSTRAEWVRFVTLFTQGITQESFHPNAFGQQALGTCLRKLWNTHLTTTRYHCTGSATDSPADVHVEADIV